MTEKEAMIDELLKWAEEYWEMGSAGLVHRRKVILYQELVDKLNQMKEEDEQE